MNRGLEFKVGLTVLMAIVIAIVAIVWLKEISLHTKKRVYHVAFPTTGGLSQSDEILVNGIRKGQVRDMHLVADHVVVDIELESDVTLTHDCRVSIRDVGMMGEKEIAIDLRRSGVAYSDRDTVPGEYEFGIAEVMGRIGNSVDALNGLVSDLRDITHDVKANGQLGKTVQDFAATSHELRALVTENRAELSKTMQDFADAAQTTKSLTTGREVQLRGALDHFSSAAENMDRLSGRLDSLRSSMQVLTTHVNSGDGTLGRLVNDQKLYDDLSASVTSLRALIEDIKQHPKKYFKVSVF